MFDWYDLNARHEATILWVATVLVVALATSGGVRGAVFRVLRTLLKPSISLLIIGLVANVAMLTMGAVIVGRKVGFWETPPIVTATIWLLTAGLALLLSISEFVHSSKAFRRRAVAVLGPSTVVAEIVGVGILGFWWELLLIPILFLIVVVVYGTRSAGCTAFSTGILLLYTAGLMLLVVVGLVGDPENWRSVTQAMVFPVVLTIGTLPYIGLLVGIERVKFYMSTKRKTIRSVDYGKDWPLIVDSAKLCCKSIALWLEVNGRKYGVNGPAKGFLGKQGYECLDLNDILRDHPDQAKWFQASGSGCAAENWKVPIDRLIRDGQALKRQ